MIHLGLWENLAYRLHPAVVFRLSSINSIVRLVTNKGVYWQKRGQMEQLPEKSLPMSDRQWYMELNKFPLIPDKIIAIGSNRFGQLGCRSSADQVGQPSPVVLQQIVDLSQSETRTIFVMVNGEVYGCGVPLPRVKGTPQQPSKLPFVGAKQCVDLGWIVVILFTTGEMKYYAVDINGVVEKGTINGDSTTTGSGGDTMATRYCCLYQSHNYFRAITRDGITEMYNRDSYGPKMFSMVKTVLLPPTMEGWPYFWKVINDRLVIINKREGEKTRKYRRRGAVPNEMIITRLIYFNQK